MLVPSEKDLGQADDAPGAAPIAGVFAFSGALVGLPFPDPVAAPREV